MEVPHWRRIVPLVDAFQFPVKGITEDPRVFERPDWLSALFGAHQVSPEFSEPAENWGYSITVKLEGSTFCGVDHVPGGGWVVRQGGNLWGMKDEDFRRDYELVHGSEVDA